MKLIFDTSVLIDLNNAEILNFVSKIDCELLYPSLLEDELKEGVIDLLKVLKFQPVVFDFDEEMELREIGKSNKRLTACDVSVYFAAKKYDAICLTGDKKLKELAEKNNIEVHGIIWLLDMMVNREVVYPMMMIRVIKDIQKKGARLPDGECDKFISKWKQMIRTF